MMEELLKAIKAENLDERHAAVEKMAERVYAARLLMAGNTYSQVMSRADISSATLSRVSRCVQYGQGYSRMLKDE